MIFVLFFMFRDGATMANHGQSLIPLRLQNKEQLSERIHETVKGLARGLFLTSLIQGALATVGYLIVGAEGAFLLGALTAAAGLFPVVGTLGVSIPAAIFFLLKGSYPKGLFLLFWGLIVVVGIVDTLVRPYLIGKKFKLPLFAWFFSLWGGVEVWGAKGIILGPLLVAIAPSLLDIYRQRYLRQPPVAEKDITCGRLPYMT